MGVKLIKKTWFYYVVGLIVVTLSLSGYVAWQIKQTEPAPMPTAEQIAELAIIEEWCAPLTPMMIGSVQMEASVASTTESRTKGLSGTPYLPAGVVKLFVFDESEKWSFWMKDMNYAIDIIWIDATGMIVHVEESVSPNFYPKSFIPSQPAKYVAETVAGFVATNGIEAGNRVVFPAGV